MFACHDLVSQDSKLTLNLKEISSLPANNIPEFNEVINYATPLNQVVANETKSANLLLNELNSSGVAQSYPWLSDDGLRVYYTQGTLMYMASRTDTRTKFGKGFSVFPGMNQTVISGWLSPDELNIYISSQSSKLYKASRQSTRENFTSYTEIKLIDAPSGSLFDASFTPDMEELLMYNNDSRERIVKFTKTAENEFRFVRELNVLSKEIPTGGQLSKDGLRYYVPFKRTVEGNDDYRYIYVLTRKNMHDEFNGIEQVKSTGVINITAYQPTINADETQMIFVTGTDNLWDNNDMCLITLVKEPDVLVKNTAQVQASVNQVQVITMSELKRSENTTSNLTNIPKTAQSTVPGSMETMITEKPAMVVMNIAPNPFNERTQIEIIAPEGGYMIIKVYAMDGQLVANLYEGESQKGVNIINWVKNGLANGVYTVKAAVGKTITTKKVVTCGTN